MEPIDLNQKLSRHFTLKEMTASGTAIKHNIDNTPLQEHVENLKRLCRQLLEPLRIRFGVIRVTSGYRCPRLNEAVGGVKNSQHIDGEAADIHITGAEEGKKKMAFIKKNLDYGQALLEHRRNGAWWIHLSLPRRGQQ